MFGERICAIIALKLPRGEEEEIPEIAEWIFGLHQDLYAERSWPYAKAAQELLLIFPAKAPPREVIVTWYQPEQLCREPGSDSSRVEDLYRALSSSRDIQIVTAESSRTPLRYWLVTLLQ